MTTWRDSEWGFGSKRVITAEDITEALGLDDLAEEHNLDMYLDLRIPVSFVSEGGVYKGTGIAEYESVETYALKPYSTGVWIGICGCINGRQPQPNAV